MLGALMGEVVTGGTVPLPAGFTEAQCVILCSIAQSRSLQTYSRGYTYIELLQQGRTLTNVFMWSGTFNQFNDGTINYLVFGHTPEESMNVVTGIVSHGATLPLPAGNFTSKHFWVSLSRVISDNSYLGLKYINCTQNAVNSNTVTVNAYGIREDLTVLIPGTAFYAVFGVP